MFEKDLIQELNNKVELLDQSLRMLKKTGIECATAERDYKMELAKEVLKLRDENMAVTLINLVIYGLQAIATLRFKRDCAKVLYESNQEAINVYKLEIKILESEINREYGNIRD